MTDCERAELVAALNALKNASEWYRKEEQTKAQMVSGLFARQRNAKLIELAKEARRRAEAQIADYRDITDQIPQTWRTVPMCNRLIALTEKGYGENVRDLVSNYKYYVRDSNLDGNAG